MIVSFDLGERVAILYFTLAQSNVPAGSCYAFRFNKLTVLNGHILTILPVLLIVDLYGSLVEIHVILIEISRIRIWVIYKVLRDIHIRIHFR